jgi:hypothetical protein
MDKAEGIGDVDARQAVGGRAKRERFFSRFF